MVFKVAIRDIFAADLTKLSATRADVEVFFEVTCRNLSLAEMAQTGLVCAVV